MMELLIWLFGVLCGVIVAWGRPLRPIESDTAMHPEAWKIIKNPNDYSPNNMSIVTVAKEYEVVESSGYGCAHDLRHIVKLHNNNLTQSTKEKKS